MKSLYNTSALLKNLTEATWSIEPAVHVGFITKESKDLFEYLLYLSSHSRQLERQRDNAVRESTGLLFGVEELFNNDHEAFEFFKKRVYEKYIYSPFLDRDEDWYH